MAASKDQKFFEILKPGTDIDFIGQRRTWILASIVASLLVVGVLFLNAFVLKDRGKPLNWGIDFRGGTEIIVEFNKPVEAGQIREAMAAAGHSGAEVVKYGATVGKGGDHRQYLIRMGAVSVVSQEQAKKAESAMAKVGDASLRRFEWSEGGDKVYLRFDRHVEADKVAAALKAAGITTTQVQVFGRPDDNNFEATLVGLDTEVKRALDARLGGDSAKIDRVESVGAKAGKQLQLDGLRALFGAIVLIVIYVAFRFDFRYGPPTIVALLHDGFMTVGAFALTYREFTLTTLAALLTIIGYSMNDTIVVFDRIRENAAKYRDRRFDRVVNQSINETLSRTILTSATTFTVTLCMNIFGTGVIRDFAFAMNVGIIVGTYSSIFVASPLLIWLNDKYVASQKRAQARAPRQARQPVRQTRRDEDEEQAEKT